MRAGLSSATGLREDASRPTEARALLAGHAAHSMLPLETRPSGGVGLFLIATAHVFGWGFPRGGSQRLADALVDRLEELGGEIRDREPGGRAAYGGRRAGRRRAARAASHRRRRCPAATLARSAATGTGPGSSSSTGRSTGRSRGLRPMSSAPRPSTSAARSRRSPSRSARPREGRHAERPYRPPRAAVTLRPTRVLPPGSTPPGRTAMSRTARREDMTERIEAQVERFAPGFRDLILARSRSAPRISSGATATSSAATSTAG